MTVPSAEETELVIVPHTHLDREWYLPFQRFLERLGLQQLIVRDSC